MRLVLPTAPSPTRTQFTLRSGAEPDRRRFTFRGKSRFFKRRGGATGESPPHTGSDTRRGFCFPTSWGSMAMPSGHEFVLLGCSEALETPFALHITGNSRASAADWVAKCAKIIFRCVSCEPWQRFEARSVTAVGFLRAAGAHDWPSLYICCGRDS